MQATETLKHEHRVIEVVLKGLEQLAQGVEAGRPLDREKAEKALEILRNFADKCHHGKEEKHLFRMMQERGVPTEGGPLGVMLHEHTTGRDHIRNMLESITGAAGGDQAAERTFVEHAHGYIELLRQHIWKEDNVLYPMAEQVLSAEDDQELNRLFDDVEENEMGSGVHEKYHKWAFELTGEEI